MAINLKLRQADESNQSNVIRCFFGMYCYFHPLADTGLQRNLGTSLSVQQNQRVHPTPVVVTQCCIAFFRHAFGHESHGIHLLWSVSTTNVENESLALVATCVGVCAFGINRVFDFGSRFLFGIVERHLGIPCRASQVISGPTVGHCAGGLSGPSTGASCLEAVVGC